MIKPNREHLFKFLTRCVCSVLCSFYCLVACAAFQFVTVFLSEISVACCGPFCELFRGTAFLCYET